MAIITDATGRQLAQAVGGIDTGGLVKDSTVQATNTALGNINTTEQSIATAINSLGQLLGNDKANISGDNIVDKATFRNNIGIGYTLLNTYTSNGQTLSHNLSNYSKILIVAYFTNTSNTTYVVGSLSLPTSEAIDNHPIVCFNDGTLRKGQLNFKTTYATTENFGNITALKVYGGN